MRAELPAPGAGNRRIVRWALALVGLMAIPVVALMLLQLGVLYACSTETTAEGVADGHIAWRITRMQCRNGREAFWDVAVGAEDKALTTALTSRGAPVPLGVVRLEDGLIGVRLDRARGAGANDLVKVPLRRSGSPKERIDLQADATRPALPQR